MRENILDFSSPFVLHNIICTGGRVSLHVSLFLLFLFSWKVGWLQFNSWELFRCACVLLLPVDYKSTGGVTGVTTQASLFQEVNKQQKPWPSRPSSFPQSPSKCLYLGLTMTKPKAHIIAMGVGAVTGVGDIHSVSKLSWNIFRELPLIPLFSSLDAKRMQNRFALK